MFVKAWPTILLFKSWSQALCLILTEHRGFYFKVFSRGDEKGVIKGHSEQGGSVDRIGFVCFE